ncbi:inactive hydroxysteroid dehydrogenase-like protein 1 [Tetranychus urticae]|nr:inactive hydroxysteroid dehydrogenase-like protein 1 [Tetranychus urticae]XP_015790572.1 inactive hydroxysteroid dehydrogenase-like protein 1 [Tetranychus urticae]XP_015790573.1 inactive hydroxysteroid dehydrogenase-like protein 1 [Tetranychus urticae]
MSSEVATEVPFTRRSRRTKLGQYWATMGFIFQIIRDIDPKLKYLIDTFTLLGFIWTTKTLFSLVGSTLSGLRIFLWSRLWRLNLKKKYGEWVVITGATDGIGLEYAREFASRGHSLILIGRNETKLDNVKRQLSSLVSSNKIVTVQADFNESTPELFKRISTELEPYQSEIGILVNNAGVMFESPNRFMDQPEDMVWQHVKVNITGVLMMTRVVLPGMINRRRGLVINMSSIAGFKPLPLMGVYSASKKFVEWFSNTLDYEYCKSHNIDVQTLVPSYVSTKMTKWSNFLQKPNITTPDARSFARSAIATIGRTKFTTGYWSHGIQWFAFEWLCPSWMYSFMSWNYLRNIDSSGRRAKDT